MGVQPGDLQSCRTDTARFLIQRAARHMMLNVRTLTLTLLVLSALVHASHAVPVSDAMTERDSRGMLGDPGEKQEEDGLVAEKRGCTPFSVIFTFGACFLG